MLLGDSSRGCIDSGPAAEMEKTKKRNWELNRCCTAPFPGYQRRGHNCLYYGTLQRQGGWRVQAGEQTDIEDIRSTLKEESKTM